MVLQAVEQTVKGSAERTGAPNTQAEEAESEHAPSDGRLLHDACILFSAKIRISFSFAKWLVACNH